MAVISRIGVTDNVAYDFFSKMAKKNNCEYRQIQLKDDLTSNFLMNETRFDCYLTKDGRVVGGQGFKTSNPVNYVKNLLKMVTKLPCSEETRIKVLEEFA